MRFYLCVKNQTIQVNARVESDDRESIGEVDWSVSPGERLFSVPYDELLLAAQQSGYIDINQDGKACDPFIPDEHSLRIQDWKNSVIFYVMYHHPEEEWLKRCQASMPNVPLDEILGIIRSFREF